MSEKSFTESVVEEAALAWLEGLGYVVKHLPARQAGGPDISPTGNTLTLALSQWERESWRRYLYDGVTVGRESI